MHNKEELAILAGWLDFFSDRATAHASFAVAGTFGIFTVLLGNDVLPRWLFSSTYVALLLMVGYSFLNFGFYATMAEIIRKKLGGKHSFEYDQEIKSELKRGSLMFYTFSRIKYRLSIRNMRFWILSIIWFIAVVLPFLWILSQPI